MGPARDAHPRAAAAPEALAAVVPAVSAFTAELYAAVAAAGNSNLVCSPYSVAVALAMTVQGARGTTAEQMLAVLHSPDAAAVAAGFNALDQALAARARADGHGQGGAVELAGANSLWGQRGTTWQQPFLDVLAAAFGTGMHEVDYVAAAEQARSAVNAWVSAQTHDRIPELVPAGVFDRSTRLTLVDALYLKAAWQVQFAPESTAQAPFTRLDGSTSDVALMHAEVFTRYATGPGWVAVDLPYVRDELAMTVVVPDAGRFREVEQDWSTWWAAATAGERATVRVRVGLPRWTTRTRARLGGVLAGLGMPLAFTADADFGGITADVPLAIDNVLHEGFVAVDEAGTEAAAATAVVVRMVTARRPAEVSVVADRPFLYAVRDVPTGTPLFVGRVLDPTAG